MKAWRKLSKRNSEAHYSSMGALSSLRAVRIVGFDL